MRRRRRWRHFFEGVCHPPSSTTQWKPRRCTSALIPFPCRRRRTFICVWRYVSVVDGVPCPRFCWVSSRLLLFFRCYCAGVRDKRQFENKGPKKKKKKEKNEKTETEEDAMNSPPSPSTSTMSTAAATTAVGEASERPLSVDTAACCGRRRSRDFGRWRSSLPGSIIENLNRCCNCEA